MATQVAIGDLSSWLSNQPDNTVDTPYEIEVTGLNEDNYYNIKTALRNNGTKYVDLSATNTPSNIESMHSAFKSCTSLVGAPVIPNAVYNIDSAFEGCSALVNVPVIPNSVTSMAGTFNHCSSLVYKPIIPSSVTSSIGCYTGVSTNNWNGTESQVNTFIGTLDATTDGFEIQVYNDDRVTLEDTYSVVGINNLDTYLASLPANTVDTPCKIEITGLTSANFPRRSTETNDIRSALLNNIYKYVDLSATTIPNVEVDSKTVNRLFLNCTTLIYPPVLSEGITGINDSFDGCINLKEVPVIPSSVLYMTACFFGCTSLKAPAPISSYVTNMNNTYENCVNLDYKYILPSTTVTASTDCYKNVPTTKWRGTASQIETWIPAQTSEFECWEIEGITPTGRKFFGVDIANYVPWSYQQEFNSEDNPYGVKILGLTTSNYTDLEYIGYNRDVFVDLRYTDLPSGITSIKELFPHRDNLVYPPTIPNTVTDMEDAFISCMYLKEPPVIPSGVITMKGTFYKCVRLESAPVIPNTVTNLSYTFADCQSMTTAPTIPNSVTNMEGTFDSCGITTPPTIPSSVTNLNYTFAFGHLTSAPVIPSSVTSMDNAFSFNSHITEVAIIPSSVTSAKEAFNNCTSLRKIDEFQIPLNTLKNNADFQNMFQGCTSLESIGYVIRESSWHVWRLKFGNDTVEGKVFFPDDSAQGYAVVNIPQTSITKSDLQLPVLTDELWFPHGQDEGDSFVDDRIAKMIQNKYGVYKKLALAPDQKNFVMYADDPNNFVTNLPISAEGIFNTVYPIGCVYTQYPSQLSPNELWGSISTWELLNYGGAFFRADGGNAGSFDEKSVTAISGKVITVPNHGASAGCLVYDPIGNETRTVSSVSGNNITLDSAFTSLNLTNVLIGQPSANLSHRHGTYTSYNIYNNEKTPKEITNTGGMSGNSSGSISCASEGLFNGRGNFTTSGCLSVSGNTNWAGGDNGDGGRPNKMSINVAHTHNMQHKHTITADGGTEARSVNFTYKVWKRIA